MLPFGNETVTLIRRTKGKDENGRTKTTYTVATLTGCSWRRSHALRTEAGVAVPYEVTSCRVPIGQAVPQAGDLMILGEVEVSVTSGAEYQQIIEEYKGTDGAFVVVSVKDNARSPIPYLLFTFLLTGVIHDASQHIASTAASPPYPPA